MANFNYTARDKSGALTRGNLAAADRAAALEALKAKGLVPVSVEVGAAASGRRQLLEVTVPRPILAAAGVALLLVCGWYISQTVAGKRTTSVGPVKADSGEKAPVVVAPRATEGARGGIAPEPALPIPEVSEPAPVPMPVDVSRVSIPRTNSVALRMPPKAERVITFGLRRGVDTNAPNPYATFRTKTERMMSMMLSAKPGEMMVDVSFGRDFDQDFAESLKNVIEIYDTDSEEMASHKEDVAWLKDEMRKRVQEGQSAEAILKNYRDQHNAIADYRLDLQRQLSALKKEGKLKEAEEFAKEANQMLAPYGTKPLVVNPVIQRRQP